MLTDMDVTNIPRLRRQLDVSASALTPPSGVPTKSEKIGELTAEWVLPPNAHPEQVMLYLHGGGYSIGSIETHRGLVAKIAKDANIKALAIDYRLAPEHPFPAALEDAVHAYHWLLDQGYASDQIILAGDSAGGGLVMALQLCLKEMQVALPAGSILFSPWVDLGFTGESVKTHQYSDPIVNASKVKAWGEAYAGEYPLTHPMISPLFGELSGLPPVMIQVSDAEVLTDDSIRLAHAIEMAGGVVHLQVWEGLIHVWQLFWRYIPEAREALEHTIGFIHRQLNKGQMDGGKTISIAV